jgi:hypothetical protein
MAVRGGRVGASIVDAGSEVDCIGDRDIPGGNPVERNRHTLKAVGFASSPGSSYKHHLR